MSQGKKKLIGYAYDKSDLDPTKERFDNFIESLLPHHYTESNDSSEKTLSTEEELQQLRQASRDAIQKSWKEVENLQEECVKSCDTISHLSSDLHESCDALSKAKERIIKLEKELKYYHEIPDVLTKRLDERRKRMSLEFKSTIGDYQQQPQRRSQSASMMTHSHHDISNDASSEVPRRASIPLFTRMSPSYRIFPTKRESIIRAITVGGSTSSSSSSTTINGDNDSSNNKVLSNDSPERTSSNNGTNATPTPAVTTITANHESSPSSAATTTTPAATAATAASLRDCLSTCSQEDLDLKISSRDAAISTLEQTVQDNVGQVVQMDQELKRLRDLLSQNNIAYDESTNEIEK